MIYLCNRDGIRCQLEEIMESLADMRQVQGTYRSNAATKSLGGFRQCSRSTLCPTVAITAGDCGMCGKEKPFTTLTMRPPSPLPPIMASRTVCRWHRAESHPRMTPTSTSGLAVLRGSLANFFHNSQYCGPILHCSNIERPVPFSSRPRPVPPSWQTTTGRSSSRSEAFRT